GRNIGKIQELVDVARSVDLSAEEAKEVLEARGFREAVDSDWSRARSMGVTAVPTFLLDQRFVVGAQPYEVLEELLTVSEVKKRHSGR
ncbi:MAG: thioredoxin domain-containing protein, partial [Desulfobacteraceae bacterium]|nr:thioredoxin domain-containing protein [Desulfobacteraceae bacterium]